MEYATKPATPIELRVTAKTAHPINDALLQLLATLNSVRLTYNVVMPRTAKWLHSEYDKHEKVLRKFSPSDDGGATKFATQTAHDVSEALLSVRAINDLMGTQIIRTLHSSLFTQIFCEFDSFVGALLRAVYSRKADLLKGISREISLTELLEFDSLEAVKKNMLEKEVETFRRDSYVEQFLALERKFGFKTLRQFKEWGDFVELSQRRNIIIHNGGLVSDQYLAVCDREGYVFSNRPLVGQMLEADGEYISNAIRIVSLVGFMLAHTLWRKVFPAEVELADGDANDAIFGLLEQKRWQTAMAVSEFALSEQMRKSIKEIDLRIRIVNCAIALKFSEKEVEARKLLESIDWSASYRDFRLAKAVLLDDFSEACELMLSIGRAGEIIDQLAYHRFPLFHKFREDKEFQSTYEKIYGESFVKKAMEEAKGVSVKFSDDFEESEGESLKNVRKNGSVRSRKKVAGADDISDSSYVSNSSKKALNRKGKVASPGIQ